MLVKNNKALGGYGDNFASITSKFYAFFNIKNVTELR